ncbi:MAG: metal-dependent hydrolase [Gemmatimonadaceae bacterium]
MENITHSLMGATLAELALPRAATPSQRRLFFAAGIIAANLPDADLVYTRITAPPLGYLLHHRGHTHTVVGLIVLGMLIWLVSRLPAVSRRIGTLGTRFAALVGIALASHLVLDAWNSYGVHPFWPLNDNWFYGDAIFIVEPWLWVLLGVALVMNAHSARSRGVVVALLAVCGVGITWIGMISALTLGVLALGAFAVAMLFVRLQPRTRLVTALVMSAVFVNGVFVARHLAEERVLRAIARGRTTELVDVVLSSHAANPLCWFAIAIVKDESANEYTMTRADVSVADAVSCGRSEHGRVAWETPVRQSLTQLRALVQSDCNVRAWMQFGRAPFIRDHDIGDMRFSDADRGNFSTMPFGNVPCAAHLTNWGMPRADLL